MSKMLRYDTFLICAFFLGAADSAAGLTNGGDNFRLGPTWIVVKRGSSTDQKIKLPDGWATIDPNEWVGTQWQRKSVVFADKGNLLAIVTHRSKQTNMDARILVFRLHDGHYQYLTENQDIVFSEGGSFFLKSGRLFVWDTRIDSSTESNNSPHKYVLREFSLTGSSAALSRERVTAKKYGPGVTNQPMREKVPSSKDPLREFGLTWKWWAPSF